MEPISIVIAALGLGAAIVFGVLGVRHNQRTAREAERRKETELKKTDHERPTPAVTGGRKDPTFAQEPDPEIDPLLAKPDREVRGRDADIERIDRAFKDRGNLPAVAITGPGGCGKTTLAGEYARRRARRYHGVWLVDATSLGETRNSLALLGRILKIKVSDNVKEGINDVLNALKAEGGRWL